jgi:hypothetical protein
MVPWKFYWEQRSLAGEICDVSVCAGQDPKKATVNRLSRLLSPLLPGELGQVVSPAVCTKVEKHQEVFCPSRKINSDRRRLAHKYSIYR